MSNSKALDNISVVIAEYAEYSAMKREIDARIKELRPIIEAAVGTADSGTINGVEVLTFKRENYSTVNREALRELAPEVWAQVVSESVRRVLRVKGAPRQARKAS